MVFASGQCLAPTNIGPCAGEAAALQDLSASQEFQAFDVEQAVNCSTLGRTEVDVFAGQALEVTREYAVGFELLAAGATGNPSLSGDATELPAAADPTTALGCLEQAAAFSLSGRLAFIHVPPAVGTNLLAAGAIWRDNATWRTASGNVVVLSPAYDGRDPGGDAPSGGDPLFMYATGEVYAETAPSLREVSQSVDRPVNTAQAWAKEPAIVVFDPCFVLAIDSGLNACEGTPS